MSDSEVNLCCPICLEKYSIDVHFPVVARMCSHTICRPCAIQRKSPVCVVCKATSMYSDGSDFPSSGWYRNFALIDCIREMERMKTDADEKAKEEKLKMELELTEHREQARIEMEQKLADFKSQYDNAIDYMSCGQCGAREKRERMKICCGCAKIKDVKSTVKDKEAEVLSATICAFCYTEFHMGHRVINCLTFKVHNLLSSTSSDGIEMVNSMNEMCIQEAQNGAEQIVAWKTKIKSFNVQHRADVTYRDCLSINDSLKKEAEIVCSASEDTLPTLRKLTKVVRESNERVSTLLSRMTTKPESEGIFGYFTRIIGYSKKSTGPVKEAQKEGVKKEQRVQKEERVHDEERVQNDRVVRGAYAFCLSLILYYVGLGYSNFYQTV